MSFTSYYNVIVIEGEEEEEQSEQLNLEV